MLARSVCLPWWGRHEKAVFCDVKADSMKEGTFWTSPSSSFSYAVTLERYLPTLALYPKPSTCKLSIYNNCQTSYVVVP
jgi:hypothetical protein